MLLGPGVLLNLAGYDSIKAPIGLVSADRFARFWLSLAGARPFRSAFAYEVILFN